ncbi:dynein heavy chain 1, cytosolic [Rhizoctonia solani AG-1 IB]|uniref:Dynein heavy chain 1, cytosolic n=1 Tax=Thanatephorus cucumeris (strain AG1-IB / isolate 7/3/14) TaxID=1108050 RepID=M5BIG5_THACB|nr:dynein heavy chain 1, cytosolic [Rhizoctonia solani AG-1 IB]
MFYIGMALRWDFFVNAYDSHRFHGTGLDGRENKHIVYVREFASAVSILQDKTNSLIDVYKDITRHVDDLATCSFTTEAFSELIAKIQAAIDQLNLEGYANLDNWVAELDAKIEALLLVRLTHIIQLWCTEFDRTEDDEPRREVGVIRDATMKKRAERRKDEKVSLHFI